MADEIEFKTATQTPPEPPRATGQDVPDQRALIDWMWEFFLATVVTSGLLDPVYQQTVGEISFEKMPDPQATTIARAQATANEVWTELEQLKTDLPPLLRKFAFGGSFTISGASTSGNPVFPADLGTTDYFSVVTPTGATGSPANDAFRIVVQTKGSGGIGVGVAGAPGVGNSVTYDYIVIGPFPDLRTTEET